MPSSLKDELLKRGPFLLGGASAELGPKPEPPLLRQILEGLTGYPAEQRDLEPTDLINLLLGAVPFKSLGAQAVKPGGPLRPAIARLLHMLRTVPDQMDPAAVFLTDRLHPFAPAPTLLTLPKGFELPPESGLSVRLQRPHDVADSYELKRAYEANRGLRREPKFSNRWETKDPIPTVSNPDELPFLNPVLGGQKTAPPLFVDGLKRGRNLGLFTSTDDIREIRNLSASGMNAAEIASKYHVNAKVIEDILKGNSFVWVK